MPVGTPQPSEQQVHTCVNGGQRQADTQSRHDDVGLRVVPICERLVPAIEGLYGWNPNANGYDHRAGQSPNPHVFECNIRVSAEVRGRRQFV
jgi:hypothetical protein